MINLFQVDLLEPVSHFLDAARDSLASQNSDMHKAVNFFCVPLQVIYFIINNKVKLLKLFDKCEFFFLNQKIS